MLTLTRREGQRIAIGPDIVVVVKGISRGSVRLGIVAPRSVEVHREELLADKTDGDPPTDGGAAADLLLALKDLDGR